MDKTKQIIMATAIAGTAFVGGQTTATPQVQVQTVYVADPGRTIEVLSKISIAKQDFDKLVPMTASGKSVSKKVVEDSDIAQSFVDSIIAGRQPSGTGILNVDEVNSLYGKAVEGKVTAQDVLNNARMYDIIRR